MVLKVIEWTKMYSITSLLTVVTNDLKLCRYLHGSVSIRQILGSRLVHQAQNLKRVNKYQEIEVIRFQLVTGILVSLKAKPFIRELKREICGVKFR